MDSISLSLTSPCIKNCCLDLDDICLGCFRSLDEITQWTQVNTETRLQFLNNIKIRQQNYQTSDH